MGYLAAAKGLRRTEPTGLFFETLAASDGETIRYAAQKEDPGKTRGTVIFVPGRTEFIEKFYEDMHVWNAYGFAVGAIDLRGQGLSHRPGPSRKKHVIFDFDQHLKDVESVLMALAAKGMPKPFYLMAHSAGSHVSLRYMHDYQDRIERAFLMAPMVAIANGGLPDFIMKSLPAFMVRLGFGAAYVPGHSAFRYGEWGWRKQLTHDKDRFEDEDHFINTKDKDLAVGGATYQFVHAAQTSCAKLASAGYAESIKTPFTIYQAGLEGIVDNAAMTVFAERNAGARLIRIEGAKHEILKETDDKRLEIWQDICDQMGLEKEAL